MKRTNWKEPGQIVIEVRRDQKSGAQPTQIGTSDSQPSLLLFYQKA